MEQQNALVTEQESGVAEKKTLFFNGGYSFIYFLCLLVLLAASCIANFNFVSKEYLHLNVFYQMVMFVLLFIFALVFAEIDASVATRQGINKSKAALLFLILPPVAFLGLISGINLYFTNPAKPITSIYGFEIGTPVKDILSNMPSGLILDGSAVTDSENPIYWDMSFSDPMKPESKIYLYLSADKSKLSRIEAILDFSESDPSLVNINDFRNDLVEKLSQKFSSNSEGVSMYNYSESPYSTFAKELFYKDFRRSKNNSMDVWTDGNNLLFVYIDYYYDSGILKIVLHNIKDVLELERQFIENKENQGKAYRADKVGRIVGE